MARLVGTVVRMPDRTIHGWPVISAASDGRLKLFTVPGTKRKIKLRADVGPYLVAFASEYHKVIAPIDTGTFDDWGWCPVRKGRASNRISDHCAGVAMDLNATKEGSQGPMSLRWWANPVKRKQLNELRKRFSLLEWGGDYSARNRDPMHWTFKPGVGSGAVLAEMQRLGITSSGKFTAP